MAKTADIGSKRLISLAPDVWVQWVTQRPDVTSRAVFSSEFQWISRESDVLIHAHSPAMGDFLVLNEIQLRYNAGMPRRMQAYAALAEERYNLPAYPVLVNILQPAAGVPVTERHEQTFMGLQSRRDYRVINLWEIDAAMVVQQPLPTLLPFVPVLRGGNSEATVRQALTLLRADEELRDLESLLAFFARFVLNSNVIQQIMRWDMTILRESPWYAEILEEGRKEGRTEERRHGLQQVLSIRFGSVPPALMPRLAQLGSNDLEQLFVAALTVPSLEAFLALLPDGEPQP
ncbi:MAG: Rpn family recombination-promoting nuclease/putative transposase [Chloroflexaceae bacterium]|nr:Rpn family recombination-promoting nuclease/putative transposase [Chloroflexaceae bacterium]